MVVGTMDNYAVIVYREKEDGDDVEILNIYRGLSIEKAYDVLDREKRWWQRHGYKCHGEEGLPGIVICRLCLWFYRKENGHEIAYPRCDEPVKILVVEEGVLES